MALGITSPVLIVALVGCFFVLCDMGVILNYSDPGHVAILVGVMVVQRPDDLRPTLTSRWEVDWNILILILSTSWNRATFSVSLAIVPLRSWKLKRDIGRMRFLLNRGRTVDEGLVLFRRRAWIHSVCNQ